MIKFELKTLAGPGTNTIVNTEFYQNSFDKYNYISEIIKDKVLNQ